MEDRGKSASGPVDRPWAILRSALVGLASLALGLVAHALSGGDVPSAPVLCGLAALAVLGATLLAQVRLPGWAVMLLLGAAQQVLHWLLGGLGGAASATVSETGAHHGGEVPVGAGAAQGHSPEVMLMLHSHLAVALLIGWAVSRYSSVERWLSRPDRRRQQPVRTEEGAPVV
ncbi:hypothetical protein [Arthrobacter sp. NPDC092385]|uniref:hypothetical protein n=1 Tax=Arthrobacter sp. NPDC092385 TaxID=3363943 RepID=UPI00382BF26E